MTTSSTERSVVDVLRAARERISDPERWCLGRHAEDASGRDVEDPRSEQACKWCAFGALLAEGMEPYGDDDCPGDFDPVIGYAAAQLLEKAAKEWPPHVNDEGGHQAVLDMYDAAIDLAEAEA